jgi:hypothetical protein
METKVKAGLIIAGISIGIVIPIIGILIFLRPPPPGMITGRYILCVRGASDYGENNFTDNGNGTITDLSTGLMWMKNDSGTTMN